jgi:hypothetical protein
MDSSFTSPAPADFPLTCDERPGAPLSPLGREVTGESNKTRRLATIYLIIEWLEAAVIFAHHQMKTRPPNSRQSKRFWTKKVMSGFLRTCGITSKLIDAIYLSAKDGDEYPPLPYSWSIKHALEQNHFAAMHMMCLGHAKSNFDMNTKWLANHELSATFGKQANKYLRDVQALRCNHFFDAHPLSTSTWGTGVWVSENYLFFGRTQKFFATLPAILKSKHAGRNATYDSEVQMMLRFASSGLAALSRVMSEKRGIDDMDEVVKIYLDSMVEVDRWISSESRDDEEQDHPGGAVQGDSTTPSGATPPPKKRGPGKQKEPNFCKSNSLGILSAAFMHWYLGPAKLH